MSAGGDSLKMKRPLRALNKTFPRGRALQDRATLLLEFKGRTVQSSQEAFTLQFGLSSLHLYFHPHETDSGTTGLMHSCYWL